MIYGKKVYLRELLKEDIKSVVDICSSKEVLKYNGGERLLPNKYNSDNFRYIKIPSKRDYVIINNKGNIVGTISYLQDHYAGGVYSIGITIGREYWRQGFGEDSVRTLINYLFTKKKAHKIELEVVKENIAAVECYNKIGFIQEGIRRRKYYYQGTYLDTVLMGLVKEEYRR